MVPVYVPVLLPVSVYLNEVDEPGDNVIGIAKFIPVQLALLALTAVTVKESSPSLVRVTTPFVLSPV
jgi:hypothetical protein